MYYATVTSNSIAEDIESRESKFQEALKELCDDHGVTLSGGAYFEYVGTSEGDVFTYNFTVEV